MRAAVVLNGNGDVVKVEEDFIICADGGFNLLKDRLPNIIIGDMDSIKELPKGIKTLVHPSEKNYTDSELAIEWAIKNGYSDLVIYGALGGRIDHILSNFSLLAFAFVRGAKAMIREKGLNIYYHREGSFFLKAQKGDIISLLPHIGTVVFNKSTGLKYSLDMLELSPFQTGLGLSNTATDENVEVDILQGAVFVVHYTKENA